jgi:hypothetical protein
MHRADALFFFALELASVVIQADVLLFLQREWNRKKENWLGGNIMEQRRPSKEELKHKIEEMKEEERQYRREAFIEIYEQYVALLEDEIAHLKSAKRP